MGDSQDNFQMDNRGESRTSEHQSYLFLRAFACATAVNGLGGAPRAEGLRGDLPISCWKPEGLVLSVRAKLLLFLLTHTRK